jgi:hypothetical protein
LATFWWATPRLSFARLTSAGTLIGRYMLTGAGHPNLGFAFIAWDGAALSAAYYDQQFGNDEVMLARYAPACH